MGYFVAVSGGRIKRLSNRPGGHGDGHSDWGRKEERAKRLKIRDASHLVTSFCGEEAEGGPDFISESISQPTSFTMGACCGRPEDLEVASHAGIITVDGCTFITAQIERPGMNGRDCRIRASRRIPLRVRRKRQAVRTLIELAKHVAGRSIY